MNYDNSVIRRRDRLPDVPRACLVITGEKTYSGKSLLYGIRKSGAAWKSVSRD